MAEASAGGSAGSIPAELFESDSAEIISQYLELMDDTEPPSVFHVWSLLATAAALLGQHAVIRSGVLTVRANLFVVLIGPPAVKKSTAIDLVQGLASGTSLNFGPTDTSGQRHGLMSALVGLHRFDKQKRSAIEALSRMQLKPRRASDMALFVSELGRLWGTANRDMSDFFVDLYDSKDIDYETKGSSTRITAPLVTLLAATTPSSLAQMLPDASATHGILSRIVFVYANQIHKSVPLPPDPTEEWLDLREQIVKKLRWIDGNRNDFGLSPKARELYEELYVFKPKIDDPRFEYYAARRANILLRVAMAIAALRSDTWLIESDIQLAHVLMQEIEPDMHNALSAFGRNKAHMARSTILAFLRGQPGQSASINAVVAAAAADMTRREAEEVIAAMVSNNEITQYGTKIILGSVKRG